MKQFSPDFADHLASGVTQVCSCWRLVRTDNLTLGFTDHDRVLQFDGVTYHPETGMDASDAVAYAGLKVGGLEVSGILSSDKISDADLSSGFYDNARIETWLVNWADPQQRHLMHVGEIGEIRRADASFTAEIRSLTHRLDQEQGRFFRCLCDANLGDGRCGIPLNSAQWQNTALIVSVTNNAEFVVSGTGSRTSSFFSHGLARFTQGENEGVTHVIKSHSRQAGGLAAISLWQSTVRPHQSGDQMILSAGCDKSFKTCREKFGNGINFQGFPHIPGNDFSLSVAKRSGGNSGRPLRS